MQRNLKFSQKSQLLEEKENWTCLHIDWCQQLHQIEHYKDESAPELPQPPKKINADDYNLATHRNRYLQLVKQLTTFKIQLKARQGAAFIGGLGYTPRRMLYIVQHLI